MTWERHINRTTRRYSLFARQQGSNRWQRIGSLALPKEQAIRFYQDRLIYGQAGYELRLRPLSDNA